jgi:hypothetical protein
MGTMMGKGTDRGLLLLFIIIVIIIILWPQ